MPTIVPSGIDRPEMVAPVGGTIRRSGEVAPGNTRRDCLIVAVKSGRVSKASSNGGSLMSGQTLKTSLWSFSYSLG